MKDDPVGKSANAETWELIQALVLGRVPADRILELFYLSQQDSVLEMARAITSLSPESRATIGAFLTLADAKSVTANVDRSGHVILASPSISGPDIIFQEIEKSTVDTPSYVQKISARQS